MPPPRRPDIAEREELDHALARNTRAALELYLARHPQGRYRKEAEAALQAMPAPPEPR